MVVFEDSVHVEPQQGMDEVAALSLLGGGRVTAKPRPLPTHQPSPQLCTPSAEPTRAVEPGSMWGRGGHTWFCFCSTRQPSGVLALWGLVGIRCLLSAVSITPVHLSSQGQRSQPFMSWASSPWTRALPHGPHPQQDTGNKGPQERCPFLTKPGIPDDFDIIQIPFGMSPVDSQGPSSLSSPAGTLPVLQSQTYTTREGLGRPHGEEREEGP